MVTTELKNTVLFFKYIAMIYNRELRWHYLIAYWKFIFYREIWLTMMNWNIRLICHASRSVYKTMFFFNVGAMANTLIHSNSHKYTHTQWCTDKDVRSYSLQCCCSWMKEDVFFFTHTTTIHERERIYRIWQRFLVWYTHTQWEICSAQTQALDFHSVRW